ncbi:ring finger domain-containing protein [Purpureocillium lilacinum]|uniref:Ring finger domain-containing protein n=1 Tax=Purpureocillium lilacinum TaxID=33203 RepID=A0A179GH63_PURLI|nr:ring finger domain-containing protein [Purpureocillium lilacinum]
MDTLKETPRYVAYRIKQLVRLRRLTRRAAQLQEKTGLGPDGSRESIPDSLRQHALRHRSRLSSPSTGASAEPSQGRAPRESADQKTAASASAGPVKDDEENVQHEHHEESAAEEENPATVNENKAGDHAHHDRKGKRPAGPRPDPTAEPAAAPPPEVPVRPTITETRQDSAADRGTPGPAPKEVERTRTPKVTGNTEPSPLVRKIPLFATSDLADHISCWICGEIYGQNYKRGAEWPKEVHAYLHCRHVFGHECLFRWIADSHAPPNCPKCGVPLRHACEHLTVPAHRPPRSLSERPFTESDAAIVPWDYEWCGTDEGRRLRAAVDRTSWYTDRADSKKRDEDRGVAKFRQSIICKYRRFFLNRAVNKFNNRQSKWWARKWVDFAGGSAEFKEANDQVKSGRRLVKVNKAAQASAMRRPS